MCLFANTAANVAYEHPISAFLTTALLALPATAETK